MFSYDDANYFSDEDNDSIADEEEIQKEKNYQNKIDIINQFKIDIAYEPEFIGIKNICSQEILDLIEFTFSPIKIPKKYKFNVSNEQMKYFKRLYNRLEIEIINDMVILSVIFKIYQKIYVLF